MQTHPLLNPLTKAIENDMTQMAEEGHDTNALRRAFDAVRVSGSLDALARFQLEIGRLPSPPDFPYDEPDDLPAISRNWPDAASHARCTHTDAVLADRLLAAWQGRCAGCQLGKPLEGTTWPDKIRQVLELVGSWPLTDYMNPLPPGVNAGQLPDCDFFQPHNAWRNTLCRGNFDHVAPDDDIHYALASQALLEARGSAFAPQDALDNLLACQCRSSLWAAGRHAFNLGAYGFAPPDTARFGNPCRQSLGAMIRCDPFGWAAPGNPALAARMAYTDAVISQTRNGIYAGIFFATLIADTLATGDPMRAINTAVSYVPPRSRFAEMVGRVQRWCAQMPDWQQVNRAILETWPEESKRFNHAIPNAAIVLTGLIKGGGDFTRTLGITVMCGLDTDCTGATAGSIMGCALGTTGIPPHWTRPFNDTIHAEVKGFHVVRISAVAQRMFEVAKKATRPDQLTSPP